MTLFTNASSHPRNVNGLRPRCQLTQSTSVCECDLRKSHEWLTDDLDARTIGSNEKTFLLIL
jgi:hypothetical protein